MAGFPGKGGLKGRSGPPLQHKRLQARAGGYSETAGEHYLRLRLVIELSLLAESIKES
jgi:hypothetical protein